MSKNAGSRSFLYAHTGKFLPNLKQIGTICFLSIILISPAFSIGGVFTTTYSCGDGEGTPPDSILGHEPSYSAVLADNTCTAPTGKVFSGWLVNSSNTVEQPGTSVGLMANDSIIAQWSDPVNNNNNNNNAGVIPANAGCNQSVLNTTSGSAALEAIYTPNTINTQWYTGYGENGQAASPTTCSYDGTINLPATNPSRPGYAFNGWTLRVPAAPANPFANLDTSINYDTYGLSVLSDHSREATFSYGKVIVESSCSDVQGVQRYVSVSAANTMSASSTGDNCWCRVIGFTPNNGSAQSPLYGTLQSVPSSSWVYLYTYYVDPDPEPGAPTSCEDLCITRCYSWGLGAQESRQALYNAAQ